MQWGPMVLCCWPGLPGLWYRGRWSSLILALAFSMVLNGAILSSFIWTEILFDRTFPAVAWPFILMFWSLTAWLAFQNLPDVMAVKTQSVNTVFDNPDTLFIDARSEYLKGHWQEAEKLLLRQLYQSPRDVESRLMLATLYRHTRQFDDAQQQQQTLAKFDESEVWQNEIIREQRLLELVMEYESTPEPVALETSTNNDGFVRKTTVDENGREIAVVKVV